MKKPKIKFSGDWKGLLLSHGEKAVVGAAALSVVFFALSAIGREGLDSSKQPAAIETLAVRAREHIQKAQEMEAKEAFDPTGYLEKEKLAVEPFALAKAPNPRLFEPKLKRSDPKLLTVQQLEVTAGFGGIALKDPAALRGLPGGGERGLGRPGAGLPRRGPPGRGPRGRPPRGGAGLPDGGDGLLGQEGLPGGDLLGGQIQPPRALPTNLFFGGVQPDTDSIVEGRRWVMLTALVPLEDQRAAFDAAFAKAEAHNPQRDRPIYRGYLVERAEAVEGGEPEWQRLQVVTMPWLTAEVAKWQELIPDIADARYVVPPFTMPLPPLVMRDWDEEAKHSTVPLQPIEEDDAGQGAEPEEQPAAPGGFEDVDPLAGGLGGPGGLEEGGGGRAPGGRMPRGRGMLGAGGELGPGLGDDGAHRAPHAMLRFVDFSVQPDKKYIYRVSMALNDPNYRIPPRYLNEAVIKRRKESNKAFLITAASEPSAVAEIPSEVQVFAGGVVAVSPGRMVGEPKGQVLFGVFEADGAHEPKTLEEGLSRGSLADFERTVQVIDAETRTFKELENHRFKTGAILIDLRGGERLHPRNRHLTAPGEMLFAGADGRLFVRSEIDDRYELQFFNDLFLAPPPTDDGGGLMVPGLESGYEEALLEGGDPGGRRPSGRGNRRRTGRE